VTLNTLTALAVALLALAVCGGGLFLALRRRRD
jgi:hypothetical protein